MTACKHVWRIARGPYRTGPDGFGFYHDVIEWYCEKCRKREKRAA